jgi:hypothetical protein
LASFTFMATSPNSQVISHLSGSGIGFYGSGFANSVAVGEYQDTSFVTDQNGTINGYQINNVKYLNSASGILNSASSGVSLLSIPNYLSTFIAEFSHSSAVRLQNTKLYIYDRSSINNSPSGLICKVAEIIHPDITQLGSTGSGSQVWETPAGSSYMTLTPSPGRSGLYVNGASTIDDIHTHYIAISQSPNSVGSKTLNAFYIETEYL